MIDHLNWTATYVFLFFFVLVTVMGFMASRWKAGDLDHLNEWGLGGRQFGPWITWFLLGGDLYTAYTVIAVPALVYALGAFGFFAVPYTVMIYPLVFLLMPRLWSVCARHGYVTAGDFVLGRFGNGPLEAAVALTGIFATMPYIALQLVGMEKVIKALGFEGRGWMADLPLITAFVILALYTYKSGLRAPALIAFVKDAMIYIFVIAAIVIIPYQLGGFGAIFDAAGKDYAAKVAASGGKMAAGLTLTPGQMLPFITTAIGSALALFMYPHSMTGVLAASSAKAVRTNAITLPAYSLVLGLLAMLGLMAHAAHVKVDTPTDVVPALMLQQFPAWFAGFTFAAIMLGALVPAAIMSIGAANTFTRNLWKPFVHNDMSPREEAALAKVVSLVVKLGALAIILFVDVRYALDFQLLGGVMMVQILPAIWFGLFTRRIHGWPLFIGWCASMLSAGVMVYQSKVPGGALTPNWNLGHLPFGFGDMFAGKVVSIILAAFVVNVVVSVVLSMLLPNLAPDATQDSDYSPDPALIGAAGH